VDHLERPVLAVSLDHKERQDLQVPEASQEDQDSRDHKVKLGCQERLVYLDQMVKLETVADLDKEENKDKEVCLLFI
jgi:hypothetical protein